MTSGKKKPRKTGENGYKDKKGQTETIDDPQRKPETKNLDQIYNSKQSAATGRGSYCCSIGTHD